MAPAGPGRRSTPASSMADEVVGPGRARRARRTSPCTATSGATATTSTAATSAPPTTRWSAPSCWPGCCPHRGGASAPWSGARPSSPWRRQPIGGDGVDGRGRSGSATGHIEPFILLRCELLHRLMLLELYGGTDPRAEELYRTVDRADRRRAVRRTSRCNKGFAAQRLGRRVAGAGRAAALRAGARADPAIDDGRPVPAHALRHHRPRRGDVLRRPRLPRPPPLRRPAQRRCGPCRSGSPSTTSSVASPRSAGDRAGRRPPRPRRRGAGPLAAVATDARPLPRPPRRRLARGRTTSDPARPARRGRRARPRRRCRARRPRTRPADRPVRPRRAATRSATMRRDGPAVGADLAPGRRSAGSTAPASASSPGC